MSLFESMQKIGIEKDIVPIKENLAVFVYGITDYRPRTMDKNTLCNFALQNVNNWSTQEPSKQGYVWKMRVDGDIDDKTKYVFISCKYNE